MRIFFTTDVHASDRCFRKFLNAAKFYGAQVLILGADITGKTVVPVIAGSGGVTSATFGGERQEFSDPAEISAFEKLVADTGAYTYRCDQDEATALNEDPEAVRQLFSTLIRERLAQWVQLADERLDGSNVVCLINAGNDDPLDVDDVLRSSEHAVFTEGTVLELPNGMQIASCGYGNITPWNCPRDIPEEELEAKLEAVAGQIRDPAWSIFNFHVPPYDSIIDLGPKLGYGMQMKMSVGGLEMTPVGSKSCRTVIEKYQPLLAVHGHLHESRGTARVGKTPCLNPGSEYQDGILRGAVIDIDDRRKKVKTSMLVAG
jgi:uncharacterized protein